MQTITLRRYTDLPFLLHTLRTRELALLSPDTWDDKNDIYYMETYRKYRKLDALYALCFSQTAETYHHWKIFTTGPGGVCIKMDKARLVSWISTLPGLDGASVQYPTIERLKANPPLAEDLPFVKRFAFRHEREFRLILIDPKRSGRVAAVPLPVEAIEGITVNPWVPREVFRSIRASIQAIPSFEALSVLHSTVVQNTEWKGAIAGGA